MIFEEIKYRVVDNSVDEHNTFVWRVKGEWGFFITEKGDKIRLKDYQVIEEDETETK